MMYLEAPIQPETTDNKKIKWTPKVELVEESTFQQKSKKYAKFEYNDPTKIADA